MLDPTYFHYQCEEWMDRGALEGEGRHRVRSIDVLPAEALRRVVDSAENIDENATVGGATTLQLRKCCHSPPPPPDPFQKQNVNDDDVHVVVVVAVYHGELQCSVRI